MPAISLAAARAALDASSCAPPPPDGQQRPHILGHLGMGGGPQRHMLGVIRIPAGSTTGFFERHDGGDELLLILAGRLVFTVHAPDGTTETVPLAAGDLLLIPRGHAHGAEIHEDVEILFLTPEHGNTAWSDDPAHPPRH